MNTNIKILCLILIFCSLTLSLGAQEILNAAKEGNLEKIIALTEKDSSLLLAKDGAGRTALHFSANAGHEEVVGYILAKGVNVNIKTKAGTTPLHYAALSGHVEVVKILVANSADLEIKNNQTVTPLYYAAMRGHLETVKYLLNKGANVDAYDGEQGTPLHAAAQAGLSEMVKFLVENGADVKTKDTNGLTAMHFAARNGNKEIISFLIEGGLEIKEPDLYGKTPLYYAAAAGQAEAVEKLWSFGVNDVNEICRDGNTYMHAAAVSGLKDFCEKLIANKANINVENIYGATPLDMAISDDKKEIAEILIATGAKKRSMDKTDLRGNYLGQKEPGMKPVLFAPGVISTDGVNERDVTFSSDGNEFYFSRWGGGKPFNIMHMKQVEGTWSKQEQAAFSGQYNDAEAYFTPDEKKMFFISNRPESGTGNPVAWEIWSVSREKDSWSAPTMLGSPFDSGYYPTFTKTWKMYFTQNRDIYRAEYSENGFSQPEKLHENINSEEQEYNSFVSPDEDYLIFTSIREGDTYGNGDLYICFRDKDDVWSKAINMGPDINSFARDYCPSVSPDGKFFFFSSRRYGAEDIFWVDAQIIEKLRPENN